MLYEIKNLVKNYDGRNILDISCSLQRGKITGLLGPNGAGKTTLLEVLAFLMQPTSGDILFKGSRVDFAKADLTDMRKKVVLLHQKPILFSTTVYSNVEFPLRIRNVKKSERQGIADQLLAMVGMEKFSRAKANKLSGGETQRVAIAQALACSPEVILMDEPTSSIDIENRVIIEAIIQEINRTRGISVIFTTHDRGQAARLADNIVYLNEGRLADSLNENIFSGSIERDKENNKFFITHHGIKIPVRTEKTGFVRISIDPAEIKLGQETDDFSSGCTFKGKVIQLTDEQKYIRVLIDIGISLSVTLERDIYLRNPPGIGGTVFLDLPPEKIEIF
jgi:tungstate transport system ATP-binding protein